MKSKMVDCRYLYPTGIECSTFSALGAKGC